MMKAVVVESPGGPEKLGIGEAEKPKIASEHHVLVRVKAAGVNRADTLQRQGTYPPPPGESPIIGLEISGIVEEIGAGVTRWKVGDKIMGLLAGGGYAEYVTILESHAIAVPDHMSFEEAAAIPEAFLTAYQSIFYIAHLSDNQKVLIHAGGSGVGTAGIQLASLLKNAAVFVTAGTQDKIDYCQTLGAAGGANYKEGPWLPKIREISQGGVDVVLDCIGQSYFSDNLEVLNNDGTLVEIGWLSGSTLPAGVSLNPILRKRLTIHGTTLRARPADYKTELIRSFQEFVGDQFEPGKKLKPIVAKVFTWDQVGEAHKFMEASQNVGKIILTGM